MKSLLKPNLKSFIWILLLLFFFMALVLLFWYYRFGFIMLLLIGYGYHLLSGFIFMLLLWGISKILDLEKNSFFYAGFTAAVYTFISTFSFIVLTFILESRIVMTSNLMFLIWFARLLFLFIFFIFLVKYTYRINLRRVILIILLLLASYVIILIIFFSVFFALHWDELKVVRDNYNEKLANNTLNQKFGDEINNNIYYGGTVLSNPNHNTTVFSG